MCASARTARGEVEVNGFDYFDTAKGELVSGGKSKIAMWLLDTDYDEPLAVPASGVLPDGRARRTAGTG